MFTHKYFCICPCLVVRKMGRGDVAGKLQNRTTLKLL